MPGALDRRSEVLRPDARQFEGQAVDGWLVAMRPDDWPAARAALIRGVDVAGPYRAKMEAEDFSGCRGP